MSEFREGQPGEPTIGLFGWTHDDQNVQGAIRAVVAFRRFASQFDPSQEVIFFDETSDIPRSRRVADHINGLVDNFGITGYEVASNFSNRYGRMPTDRELDELLYRVSCMNLADLIDYSLDPSREIDVRPAQLMLYAGLDGTRYPFTYRYEAHRRSRATNFGRRDPHVARNFKYASEALKLGEPESTSRFRSVTYDLNRTHIRYREPKVVNQVARMTRQYDDALGGIFLLYGAAHGGMAEKFKMKTRGVEVIHVGRNGDCNPSRFQTHRNPEGSNPRAFSCELIMQAVMEQLLHQFRDEGLAKEMALSFEDVEGWLYQLIHDLPEDVLEKILSGGITSFTQEVIHETRMRLYGC